eukprot:13470072-Alexandrium_andersonii.AAC.1
MSRAPLCASCRKCLAARACPRSPARGVCLQIELASSTPGPSRCTPKSCPLPDSSSRSRPSGSGWP